MTAIEDSYHDREIDYKLKYKTLKKRLKLLVYEQECFVDELRQAQKKLLIVAKDRSFLLDRLMQYEEVDESSGDEDATASSDSDGEGRHRDGVLLKRKRFSGHWYGSSSSVRDPQSEATTYGDCISQSATAGVAANAKHAKVVDVGSQQDGKRRGKAACKKLKSATKVTHSGSTLNALPTTTPGQMTREELERHLDAKRNVFDIEKATASLPMDIFSNDNSNNNSDLTVNDGGTGDDEDEDLIIDIPQ